MQQANKYVILPIFVGAIVLLISFTLLVVVGRSPYTHANLNVGFDPSYTRTVQTLVGAAIPVPANGLAVPASSDPVEHGKQLFVSNGCAFCHGLNGQGGIIGPSIAGTQASKLRSKTSVGPQGMPAYAPGALTDADLAAIAAYLNATNK